MNGKMNDHGWYSSILVANKCGCYVIKWGHLGPWFTMSLALKTLKGHCSYFFLVEVVCSHCSKRGSNLSYDFDSLKYD